MLHGLLLGSDRVLTIRVGAERRQLERVASLQVVGVWELASFTDDSDSGLAEILVADRASMALNVRVDLLTHLSHHAKLAGSSRALTLVYRYD